MIDLETLSVNPTAAIATIAAVKFERKATEDTLCLETTEQPNDYYESGDPNVFYRKIDLRSYRSEELNFDISNDTLSFWERQSTELKKETFGGKNRVMLEKVLEDLTAWIGPHADKKRVWSNGSIFDIVILENAYRQLKMDVPWKYWNVRDTRTIMDVACVKLHDVGGGVLHHAVEDCNRQIKAVKMSFAKLILSSE